MFALKGKEIPFPEQDILFVDYGVYDYLLDFEISVSAYYMKKNVESVAKRNNVFK